MSEVDEMVQIEKGGTGWSLLNTFWARTDYHCETKISHQYRGHDLYVFAEEAIHEYPDSHRLYRKYVFVVSTATSSLSDRVTRKVLRYVEFKIRGAEGRRQPFSNMNPTPERLEALLPYIIQYLLEERQIKEVFVLPLPER